MPDSPTRLNGASGESLANATPASTASVTPAANALVILALGWNSSDITSVTSGFSVVDDLWTVVPVSSGSQKAAIAYAVTTAAPGSGAITINFTGTPFNIGAFVDQIAAGFDLSAPVSATGTGAETTATTLSASFSATPAADSLLYSHLHVRHSGGLSISITPQAGFTIVESQRGGFTDKYESAEAAGSNGSTFGWSLSATPEFTAFVGVEIQASGDAPSIIPIIQHHRLRR